MNLWLYPVLTNLALSFNLFLKHFKIITWSNTWKHDLDSLVMGSEDSCALQNAKKAPFKHFPTVSKEDKACNMKEKSDLEWG